ncbi:MAG: hypothetical protein ACO390_19975, partial [bacterium]
MTLHGAIEGGDWSALRWSRSAIVQRSAGGNGEETRGTVGAAVKAGETGALNEARFGAAKFGAEKLAVMERQG